MDFNLFDNERPNTDPFTGEETGLLKQAGMGVMRGGVKAAKGAALLGSPFFPSEGDEGRNPDRIVPRREDFYRFIDERLEPAEKFWTPDPVSLTTAGKVVGALAELPLQLVSGVAGIAGSVTANTGIQLIDQGVDTDTAAGVAAGIGLATTAMAGLPQAGATPLKTALLAALNPATGAVTDLAAREALQAQGYDQQAAMFDPLDPAARSVDLALGVVFGGVAHYGRWRQQAPTDVVDAIDTVERRKHAKATNPFQPETAEAKAHDDALTGALDALAEGRPVDVSEQLTGPRSPVPKSYTAEAFRNDIKEVFGVSDEQADATLALAAARARVQGVELDTWIEKNLKAVRQGDDMGAQLFQDRPIVKPFYSKLLAEVEGLQQEKWSGPELLAKLRKSSGVKEEEIAFTGLDEFLVGQKRVERGDVWAFLSDNQVRVEEVVKRDNYTEAEESRMNELMYKHQRTVEEQAEFEQWVNTIKNEKTKYSSYVVPGGKNYRELLLTLPVKKKSIQELINEDYPGLSESDITAAQRRGEDWTDTGFRSGHFDEPNILAHVRFNERTGGDGERILHLEEIQSDWHQARRAGKDVPDAPFAKSWHELAMRRMLRWAAENGFDRLTWTTGEQQADRYDISKQVDEVRYGKIGDKYAISLMRGPSEIAHHRITEQDLPDALGKELSQKIKNGEGHDKGEGVKSLSGLDLKVGGEGMKGFYDKILPTYMEKFGRKFGARVETTEISTGPRSPVPAHSLPITEAMRTALLYEGQPLFQADKGAVSFLADGRAVIHAMEAPDFSTVVHELGHVFEKTLTKTERHDFDTWLFSQVPGAKWSVQQRELFARAFERYLAEGKAPVKDLQAVFDKFKTWMIEIYQRITGTAIDVKINDNVRAAFDRMLFADKLRQPADPEAARVQEEMQVRVAELREEMRDIWGDEEAGNRESGIGNREGGEAEEPPRMAGPLGEPLDVVGLFNRNPEQVPEMLATFLDSEATLLETAEHGKITIDGHQKSATWSTSQPWFIERNRMLKEQGGNAIGRKTAINALRQAAKGGYNKLTPGQQDMVQTAVKAISGQIDAMSRDIDGMELQPGDRFTTVHMEQRTVAGERAGRLILDNGETIPMDQPFRIVGEIDQSGRAADDMTAADIILQERGDFEIFDGTDAAGEPRMRSATEVLTEARDAVAVEQQRRPLYQRAAVCLGLG